MKHPAMNPYLPLWEYVPDGEPRIWGDRLYVYGSHDVAGSTQFCEGDYVVWSAPLDDLGSWKYRASAIPHRHHCITGRRRQPCRPRLRAGPRWTVLSVL